MDPTVRKLDTSFDLGLLLVLILPFKFLERKTEKEMVVFAVALLLDLYSLQAWELGSKEKIDGGKEREIER